MTTWHEAVERIAEEPDWTYREGYIIWSEPETACLAVVKPKIPENSLDPSHERIKRKMEGDVEFQFDINDSSGIRNFLDAWLSLFPEDLIDIDSIPDDYVPPISYDWTPALRRVHSKTVISGTPISCWWGQDASRLVMTGITVSRAPDQGTEGVLYRQEVFGNDWMGNLMCPFCIMEDVDSAEVYCLPRANEAYHGKGYYLIACPVCHVVIDAVTKHFIDFQRDLVA